jgi:hypothetical protein
MEPFPTGATKPMLVRSVRVHPRPLSNALPLPPMLIFETTVGEDGTVRELKSVHPSNPELEELFIESLRRRQYEPATLDGKPIEVTVVVTIGHVGGWPRLQPGERRGDAESYYVTTESTGESFRAWQSGQLASGRTFRLAVDSTRCGTSRDASVPRFCPRFDVEVDGTAVPVSPADESAMASLSSVFLSEIDGEIRIAVSGGRYLAPDWEDDFAGDLVLAKDSASWTLRLDKFDGSSPCPIDAAAED